MRLSVRRPVLLILLASVLATGAACNNNSTTTTTPTTPTTPTTFTVTETFSGTLTTRGSQSFSFAVQNAGTVSVTLTTLTDTVSADITPPAIGISLGVWNGTSCAVQTGIFTDSASQGAAIAGTVTAAGTLCARVYDPNNVVTDPLAFTLTVTHS